VVPQKGAPLTAHSQRRRIRTHHLRAAATFAWLAVAGALLAGACGGGDGAAGTPTVTATAATATAVAPTPDPLLSPEPDASRAVEHIRHLSVDIGARPAGTEAEAEARDYLAGELRRYGYDVTVQPFPFDATQFLPAKVSAGGESMGAIAFRGSRSGTVSGVLFDGGIGRPEELAAHAVAGGIALVERGELTFAEKVQHATAAGAAAVVIYNNEDGSLIGDAPDAAVPVVGVRRPQGESLLALLAGGAVSAQVEVNDPRGTSYNVVARPAGGATCDTVTGGHYDSVPVAPGADDNASGSGTVLEVARVIAVRKTPGAHCFVLFGAEEYGLFGSQEYVASLDDAAINALRVMLNIDVVGVDAPLTLIGDADMVEVARIAAQSAGIEATPGELPRNSGSDHLNFQRAGVPVIMLNRDDALIHTPEDAFDRIDEASVGDALRLAVAILEGLAAG
jgi:aminopeptidase YwaD